MTDDRPRAAEDLRLARLHLRLGMLTAARAELEDLERRAELDLDGLAALAEARWRGGDLEAAADAARRHLEGDGEDQLAIVIAAEAAAAEGRPGEAQALIHRAGALDEAALDGIFAGLARRAYWPAAGGAQPDRAQPDRAQPDSMLASEVRRAVPSPAEVIAATGGLWDRQPGGESAEPGAGQPSIAQPWAPAASTWVEPARPKGHANPDAELRAAREELAEAPERGLIRLALVLRLDPTLAPEVLEAVRLRREPAALVIRGDAQRMLGRHLEAEAEFAEAVEAIERDAIATARRSRHHATREDS